MLYSIRLKHATKAHSIILLFSIDSCLTLKQVKKGSYFLVSIDLIGFETCELRFNKVVANRDIAIFSH